MFDKASLYQFKGGKDLWFVIIVVCVVCSTLILNSKITTCVYVEPLEASGVSSSEEGRPVNPPGVCPMEFRKDALDSYCEKINPGGRQAFIRGRLEAVEMPRWHGMRLMVEETHKMIICAPPKTATTAFKNFLLKVTNLLDKNKAFDSQFIWQNAAVRPLLNYTSEEIVYRLDNYLKVLPVRHPLDRLVSAYHDKFVEDNYGVYFRPYIIDHFRRGITSYPVSSYKNSFRERLNPPRPIRSQIIKEHVKNYDNYSRPGPGNPLTVRFAEFLQFLIETYSLDTINDHWNTYEQLCLPCNISYDLVLKLDTMERDTDLMMKRMAEVASLNGETSFAPKHVHRDGYTPMPPAPVSSGIMFQEKLGQAESSTTEFSKILKEYKKVPRKILTKVLDIFRNDMLMFGYDIDVDNNIGMCNYVHTNSTHCC